MNLAGLNLPTSDVTWELVQLNESTAQDQQRLVLSKFPFDVGRCPPCDLVVPCAHVSRLHASFLIHNEQLFLEDKKSTNGTYLNGQRLSGRRQLQVDDIIQIGSFECRLAMHAEPYALATMNQEGAAALSNVVQFRQIVKDRAITPSFQPIVNIATGTTIGYEALVRSTRDGLRGAAELFLAAARSGMERELSELSRSEGMRQAQFLPNSAVRFLNTHPVEVASPLLIESLRRLRHDNPEVPIVLEIHESAICNLTTMKQLAGELRELEIGLAYDDFGQGQSRILELIEAPPDFLKFDMELIRGIDKAPRTRQQMLASLVQMSKDIGIMTIAEGVETGDEVNTCEQIGFDLVQGYLFGKPQPIEWIVADLAKTDWSVHEISHRRTQLMTVTHVD